MVTFDNWMKRFEVKCPYCGKDYQGDSEFLGEDLITYHGESGPIQVDCGNCDEQFFIEEFVDRTYTVGKKIDDKNKIIEEEEKSNEEPIKDSKE